MPNLNIYTLPKIGLNGHLYVTEVEDEDPVDKNDVVILFVFDGNATDFSLEKIDLSAIDDSDNDISDEVSFTDSQLTGAEGGAVYSVGLRPPAGGGDGSITIRVIENAVAEGNHETSLTVTYSDNFPKSDWESLFPADDEGATYDQIVSIDSENVYLRRGNEIHVYDWAGTQDTNKTQILTASGIALKLDSDSYLVRDAEKIIVEGYRWQSAEVLQTIATSQQSWALTENGRLLITKTEDARGIQEIPIEDVHAGIVENRDLSDKMYETVSLSDDGHEALPDNQAWYLASDLNNLYIEPRSTGDHYVHVYDTEYKSVADKWIPMPAEFITYAPVSLFIFQNLLFRYNTNNALEYLDFTQWQPPQPIGKIYPQEVTPGQRIDLKKFIKYADDIVFDVGSKIPDWLSIEDNRYLVVADDANADAAAYIRLRGINHVGASEQHGCGFYVSVVGVQIPVWKNISTLTMRTDQVINLFGYVDGGDTIEAVYGSSVPDYLDLTGGRLRIKDGESVTDPSVTLSLRAGNRDGYFADTELTVNLLADLKKVSITNIARYEVCIEGIDVSRYLLGENFPNLSASLDWVKLNQFTRGRCQIELRSGKQNRGYFNGTNPNSFWKTNDLHENGFLNSIEVFVHFQGDLQKRLIFQGVIFENNDLLGDGVVTLNCIDSSYLLKDIQVSETVEGIEKILELTPAETTPKEETHAPVVSKGIYSVENTFGEMLPKASEAFSEATPLVLKKTTNSPSGVTEDFSAFMTKSEVQTQGGYLYEDTPVPVLVKTRTPYRYLSVQAAIEKLIKEEPILLSAHVQENTGTGDAHIRTNGNLAFATERGRLLKYLVDWIVDTKNSVLYYLLSNPVDYISDELVCYDLKTETHQVLYRFDPEVATLKLASTDFDTFAVLLTDATDFDRTPETTPKTIRGVAEGYDASLNANTQIVSYRQSEHLYRTLIKKDTDFRPQAALHYWTGVAGQDYAWQGISQGDRGTFAYVDGALLYRYATDTEFGVAQRASDATLTALWTKEKDDYQNHLNFAFDVVEDDVYFAFVEGTPISSSLTIEKRSGNTTETLFTRTLRFNRLTDLDDAGGAWLGVQELLVDGENFYMIVPVSRNGRDISTGAGVILYRFSLVTLQLTPLSTHGFVQHGACALTKHDEDIFFVESPAVSYDFEARNRNLRFDASEAKGFLKRRRTENGVIETIGNVWFSNERAYRGHLPIKPLTFDDDLHFIMGYGRRDTIGHPESDASRPENWQWFSFGTRYRYKVPVLPTDGTLSSALTSLAERTGLTLSFSENIVNLQNRQVVGTLLANEVLRSETMLRYASETAPFPESGYLLIGSEVMAYTGRTDMEFTGVSRGELATDRGDHPEGALMTYVHRLIEDKGTRKSSEPYLQVTVSLDSPHLYNSVSDGNPSSLLILDADSQAMFGDQSLALNIGTNEHELPWAEFISRQYLERFKDLAYLINVRVKAFLSIELGEIVCFKYLTDTESIDGYLIAMQVMSVSTVGKTTTIRGRQVKPVVTPVVAPTADPVHATDGAGNAFFPDGADTIIGWYGDPLYIDTAPSFEVTALPSLQLTQYTQLTPIVFPEAISPIGNSFEYSLSPLPGNGLSFDARTRTLSGVPNVVMAPSNYTYTATDSQGQMIMLTQSIEIVRGVQRLRKPAADGEGETPFFADGAGGVVRWYGH